MRRVLVTGASGFIGRNALRPLADRGFEVHALGLGPLSLPYAIPSAVSYYELDLFDEAMRRQLIERVRPTHLLHFAWIVTPGIYSESIENLKWIELTLSLVREFARAGGYRLVISGSCAEYDGRYGLCEELKTPLCPQSLYGVAKNATREILSKAATALDLSLAWGRIFFVYGPGEARNRLVSDLVVSLLDGRPAAVRHGHLIRDFMHVADVGSAFAALIDSSVEGPANIASGRAISLGRLAKMIAEGVGRPDLLTVAEEFSTEPVELLAAVARLREEVGFVPRYKLEFGILDAIDWHCRSFNRSLGRTI